MSSEVPITVNEGNDETVRVTIDRQDPDDDLSGIAVVEFVLKADRCDPDTTALVLSSTVSAQVTILSRTTAQIVAEAHIPASALTDSYPRWYRVDGVSSGGARRTASFGLVTVIDN